MRLVYITVPLGALAAAAGLWLLTASTSADPKPAASINISGEPRHPITPEMATAADAMAKKNAPSFRLQDPTAGRTWTLAQLIHKKPMFIYFILDGCPCSTDAEPLFHKLYERFKGRINFVGVISSDKRDAAEWAKNHQMPYPILCDPKLQAVHSYGAKHSVYNALVTPDGKIERMWPGYSRSILKEINSTMAAVAGVREKPFDSEYAPVKLSSGCLFPVAS